MQTFVQLFAGLVLGVLVAGLAYRVGALNLSGAAAAALEGMLIFGLGGLPGAVLLLAFFVSSSALSRVMGRRKARLEDKWEKGSRRDADQVLANGGLAAIFMVIHAFLPQAAWPWVGFAGSLAAVNADTWATELGVFSRVNPVLVTTLKKVEPGTSGGVTALGLVASLAGAALIGGLAVILLPVFQDIPTWLVLRTSIWLMMAGAAGSLVDSILGATLQAIYYCPACQKETERHPLHTCGTETKQVKGLSWLNNDRVNFICAISGALAAILLIG